MRKISGLVCALQVICMAGCASSRSWIEGRWEDDSDGIWEFQKSGRLKVRDKNDKSSPGDSGFDGEYTVRGNILHVKVKTSYVDILQDGHEDEALIENIDDHIVLKKDRSEQELRRILDANCTVQPAKEPIKVPVQVQEPLEKNHTVDLGNGRKIGMVWIPPGEFTMGRLPDWDFPTQITKPHLVRLTRGFYMGVTEVTQGQWEQVMGNNPSFFTGPKELPVERVTWHEAKAFCKKIGLLTGMTFRLPTEAEWEYACRSGRESLYLFGDSESELGDYAWYAENSGREAPPGASLKPSASDLYYVGPETHPVASLKPNAWGLYDMLGNAWEWCEDRYGKFPDGLATDPAGRSRGEARVLRGGNCTLHAKDFRLAMRNGLVPSDSGGYYGFRVVLVPEPTGR